MLASWSSVSLIREARDEFVVGAMPAAAIAGASRNCRNAAIWINSDAISRSRCFSLALRDCHDAPPSWSSCASAYHPSR